MSDNLKFNEPWIMGRADPYILRTEDCYYFTASVPAFDKVILRRSDTLAGLADAEEKVLWTRHEEGIMSANVWAPEIHFLFGKWYIYYAAGEKGDVFNIRPYVLECTGDDPMRDPWVEKGKMGCAPEDEFSFRAFSLDGTVFEVGGVWYYIWAEKVSVGRQISNLYIARMKNAYTLDTVQVLLTTPDYDWERIGFWVNEGPAILKRDGRIFVTYSASETSAAYCLGMLTAKEDADLLDPRSWTKERYPVLATNPELKIYGPGHNSFTTDEDGRDLLVFHARVHDHIEEADPLDNPDRHTMLMHVDWEDGRPAFNFR